MIHRQKMMLTASTHIDLTTSGECVVATCTLCNGKRTFFAPANLWDVLDMMALHHASNHVEVHSA